MQQHTRKAVWSQEQPSRPNSSKAPAEGPACSNCPLPLEMYNSQSTPGLHLGSRLHSTLLHLQSRSRCNRKAADWCNLSLAGHVTWRARAAALRSKVYLLNRPSPPRGLGMALHPQTLQAFASTAPAPFWCSPFRAAAAHPQQLQTCLAALLACVVE